MINNFSPTSPWLVLAPHLRYPLRNGGDILMENLALSISSFVPHVILVAANVVRKYVDGELIEERGFSNEHRSKRLASIETLILNGHYLQKKFNTKRYVFEATQYLEDSNYKSVLFSYISTSDILRHVTINFSQFYMICPQNDEFKWFEDIRKSTTNTLVRFVAKQSISWLNRWFKRFQHEFLLLHVTTADKVGIDRYFPDHHSLPISIGADSNDLNKSVVPKRESSVIKLVFLGSLGSQMNFDALVHFSTAFYSTLLLVFGNDLSICIIGSNPTLQVQQLCQKLDWQLYPDVDDETLTQHLQEADFSIMPFAYATGAKLKLLKTLAYGLPFLATTAMSSQLDDLPTLCLLSDDPQEWAIHLQTVMDRGGVPFEARKEIQGYARQFSWDTIATKLYSSLQQFSDHNFTG